MLFFKKKKPIVEETQEEKQDLSITFDIETNTYNIVVNNELKKVKVLKAKDNNIILKTCYKTCGRPKVHKESE